MTATHAQLTLATQQQDVFTNMKDKSTVTIMMHVLLMDAQLMQNNAGIRLLIATIITHAQLILAILLQDVFTLQSLQLNLMTIMHAPRILAQRKTESNTSQSHATEETSAQLALATQ
jgi:hypothetical protein